MKIVTTLLKTVNENTKTPILQAKAKWFEAMRAQGVTPVNGSLTNLRKPRMISASVRLLISYVIY